MGYTGQKKKKSRIIIPVVIAIGLIAAFLLVNPVRSLIAIASMKPLATQEAMPGIYVIDNKFVNLYLFKSGDTYIAFDGGTDNKATQAALDSFGIAADDVAAVFLTHTDADHVAAVSLFPSAEIYMADSNKAFITEKTGRSRSKGFVDMNRDFIALADGETVTIADAEVRCIFTPGHTPGSACYLVDGKVLFSGDNLNLKDGKAVLFTAVFNMDADEQEQSIRKLSGLEGIEAVFTMHTGCTTDFNTAFAEWR